MDPRYVDKKNIFYVYIYTINNPDVFRVRMPEVLLMFADMIERAIINTFVGHDVVEPGNYVQMFPYPCYTRDE